MTKITCDRQANSAKYRQPAITLKFSKLQLQKHCLEIAPSHPKKSRSLGLLLLAGALILGSGCNSTSTSTSTDAPQSPSAATGSPAANNGKLTSQIVSDFADKVVIPTNQLFSQRAKELSSAIDTFVKTPNDQTLKTARDAWVAARGAWEQSESFTFGPADSLGYDGALDTWPVNETDVQAVLKSQDRLTPDYISQLKDTEKGFHAIEYLLFGKNQTKKAANFNPRELEYLQALGTDFSKVADELLASWNKGVEGKPAYREVIATAGESGNSSYPTLQAGVQEMLQGKIDSLDEVANEKIGKPLETKDVKLFESRFALNTLKDLKSNVKGAQNVYLGTFPDANTTGSSLSNYIASVKPDVDAKVKSEFQASLEALEKIPDPIETAIANPQATENIKAAREKIQSLRDLLEKEVMPLVKG
jgi:predicted lipoprotein